MQQATITGGNKEPAASLPGETPSPKNRLRRAWPAGFGALAMTVRPPPVTAPASTAYLSEGPRPSTWLARKVIAALSLKDVRMVEPMNKGHSVRLEMI